MSAPGYLLKLKEAQIRHAAEIDQIERNVNSQMGGDCDIAELVALMLTRGWIAPTPEALAAAPEVVALVEAAVKAERERCVSALTTTCDAEITQAKKLGPMHVPIIIAVKHDCIAAMRAGGEP